MPALQLLLAQDGLLHVAEHLEAHETMDLVARRKSACKALPVLIETLHKIAGDADINRSARLTRKDVDAWGTLDRHAWVIAARWMLKQVQHDGMGVV